MKREDDYFDAESYAEWSRDCDDLWDRPVDYSLVWVVLGPILLLLGAIAICAILGLLTT
jgi:uncharacterized RDD family membrane protein YckC